MKVRELEEAVSELKMWLANRSCGTNIGELHVLDALAGLVLDQQNRIEALEKRNKDQDTEIGNIEDA